MRSESEDPNYIRAGIGFRGLGAEFPGFIAKGSFRKIVLGEVILLDHY